jgi:hypothetical protein
MEDCMIRSNVKTALVSACAVLIPVIASAQKILVDYDKAVDFAKFKSYTYAAGQPAANPLIHKRIIDGLDKQLASKGWTRSESEPSAIVVYYAAVDEQRQLNAWGSGPRWSGYGTASVETILTGQIVVDVYDARTEQLLWRGFASDTITDKAEKNEKKLNEALARLFKQFPPARTARPTND